MGFSLNTARSFRHILKRDEDAADAAVFVLRTLPARMLLEAQKLLEHDPGRAMFLLVCAGLTGCERIDREGEPLSWQPPKPRVLYGVDLPAGGAPEHVVDELPVDVIAELGSAILEHSAHGVKGKDLERNDGS